MIDRTTKSVQRFPPPRRALEGEIATAELKQIDKVVGRRPDHFRPGTDEVVE
jgi:hypothetical protein